MRPLRFLMGTTFYPPYNFGGDGIGVQRLARALARRGHEVTVVHDTDAYNMLSSTPNPPSPPEEDGLQVVRLRSKLGFLSPLLTQQTGRPLVHGRRLRRLAETGGFDVIWYHNVSLLGGPGALPIGDALKIYEAHEHWLVCPTHVLWRHGREPCPERQCLRCVLRHKRPPQLWRYSGLLRRMSRHVDAFIAKSEFSRAKHHDFGFPLPMEVVPYFLPDAERQGPTSASPAPHPRPYFLFVGRLERIKGLDDVIPVFRDYEKADLLIAGAGEYETTLQQLAAGNPRVRFLGRVQPDELSRYYRHAIALLVPSVCFETFGIILIEAFKQGTPVIARRIGPFPELVERSGAGEIFQTGADLRASMARISEPEYRERLAQSAVQSFHRYWSESAVMPQYLRVVRDAAARTGRTRVAEQLTRELAA